MQGLIQAIRPLPFQGSGLFASVFRKIQAKKPKKPKLAEKNLIFAKFLFYIDRLLMYNT